MNEGASEDRHPGTVADFMRSLAAALAMPGTLTQAKAMAGLIEVALRSDELALDCQAQRLPVCDHFARAIAGASAHSGAIARLAASFSAIEPRFRWLPRAAGGPSASSNWPEGHANAMIVGPGGLERRKGIRIGVSLMAPQVRYPDHNHAQKEVYLALSPGRFKHGASAWCEPGVGGTFHNVPNITHAMASADVPFLAIWSLWENQ